MITEMILHAMNRFNVETTTRIIKVAAAIEICRQFVRRTNWRLGTNGLSKCSTEEVLRQGADTGFGMIFARRHTHFATLH